MKTPRRLALWGFLLAVASGWGRGSPLEPAVHPVGESRETPRFSFRIETAAVSLAETPDGPAVVRLEGFGPARGAAGSPDLPTHTFLVAIPPGTEPRLEIRVLRQDSVPGVQPRPLPRHVTEVHDAEAGIHGAAAEGLIPGAVRREVRERDLSIYGGAGPYPEQPARLGKVGAIRDQRYVEVIVTPVRLDPALRGLRIAREIEITVTFDGDSFVRTEPATDPRFESVYREAFVNYGQGRSFRLGPLALADPTSVGSGASGAQPAASTWPSLGATGTPAVSEPASSSGPCYRIRVSQKGAVRLDHDRMLSTGFLSEPLSTWKLTSRGVEVPLRVRDDDGDGVPELTDGNDLLDPGEWVQFYGQGLDDDPKTVLNHDVEGAGADIFEARDFSDENVYFLTVETGARTRMAEVISAPTFTRTPPSDFEAVAHEEVDDNAGWRPLGAADPWYWPPSQSNPSSGTPPNELVPSRTVGAFLPNLASGTAPARVIVRLRGLSEDVVTSPDHKSRVTLKNDSSQTLEINDDDGTFDGREIYTHDFTWPGTGGTLSNSAQVTIDALSVTGAPPSYKNQFVLDFVEVHYRRLFQALGDTLEFVWPDEDAEFLISDFTNPIPEIYEITGQIGGSGIVNAVRLTGAAMTGVGPFTIRFRVDNDPALADGTLRRFIVAGNGGVWVPPDPSFTADTVSDLRSTSNQADLIVIAHPDVLDNAAGCSSTKLTALLAHRASQGITSKVACLQDVQDEFNDGLAGPLAIESFLRWVMSTNAGEGWASPKPAYVLLLGDGSYHYKAGTAQGNYVPTQILFKDDPSIGYFASDGLMGAVVGDDFLPDLVVGRLPARTVAEADLMLQKLLDYEQIPPSGSWRRHALVVSDRGKNFDPFEATESFEATNDLALSFLKKPPHTTNRFRYWTDYCGGVASGCTLAQRNALRQDIKDEINGISADGLSMVQFSGHGNFDVWSDDAFFDNRDPLPDPADLVNGVRLPWMIAHNCLTGGFHTTAARTMGESWIKQAGGGAVAVFAPTGLSFAYFGVDATEAIWKDVFGPRKERLLATPVLDTWVQFCGQGSVEECEHYALLGDPATRLIVPEVHAAEDVQATCGNAQVSLSWTASATPGATYDVYRSTSAGGPYVKVNGSPIGSTGFSDTGVENAKTYFYYVVALDAEGFESAWSNFNGDCASAASCDANLADDCVKATPLNPNPPAPPAGLVVTDAETSGKLLIAWNANIETDLKHYQVHSGTSPGVYSQVDNVGTRTTHSLSGLINGTRYYVAITATNTSSLTSAFSVEVSEVPTHVLGIKSPGLVGDLRLTKSGNHVLLTWSAVTADIYGKTETVARYEVFRGTTPEFVPSLSNKIGEPTVPAFTDLDALLDGNPSYYYLVRAVDVDGNAGGLGRQLPEGIGDLHVDRSLSIPGNVVLSWTAVTEVFGTDGSGMPTVIAYYEIYAQTSPYDREQICDLAEAGCSGISPLMTTTDTSVDITPAPSNQYYTVLAVDSRGNKSPF